ncbi:MAG: Por secretion system C-terminal sorting protein [Bacteroidetes bacterium]|nr:Por secretion system C-terminal sorting protein [Bacteroidota bacterium]
MRFESIVLATLLLLTISVPAQAQDVRLNSIINVTFSANAPTLIGINRGRLLWSDPDPNTGKLSLAYYSGAGITVLDSNLDAPTAAIGSDYIIWNSSGEQVKAFDMHAWRALSLGQSYNPDLAQPVAVSEDLAAYARRGAGPSTQIVLHRFASDTDTLLSAGTWNTAPSIHHGQVTWVAADSELLTASSNIFMFDGGGTTNISKTTSTRNRAPILRDGQIVWLQTAGGTQRVKFYTGDSVLTIAESPGGSSVVTGYDVSNGIAVALLRDTISNSSSITIYNSETRQTMTIGDSLGAYNIHISNGLLVWQSGTGAAKHLRSYSVQTAEIQDLGAGENPVVDHDLIAWTLGDAVDLSRPIAYRQLTTDALNGWEQTKFKTADSSLVMWGNYANSSNMRLFAWNGSATIQLTDSVTAQDFIMVNDGYALWRKNFDSLFYYDGVHSPVKFLDTVQAENPYIAGGSVGFFGPRTTVSDQIKHAWLYELAAKRLTMLSSDSGITGNVLCFANTACWLSGKTQRLMFFDGSTTIALSDSAAGYDYSYRNGKVVWTEQRSGTSQVMMYDTKNHIRTQLTSGGTSKNNPITDGTAVVWYDNTTQLATSVTGDMWYYDIGRDRRSFVARTTYSILFWNWMSNGKIAWLHDGNIVAFDGNVITQLTANDGFRAYSGLYLDHEMLVWKRGIAPASPQSGDVFRQTLIPHAAFEAKMISGSAPLVVSFVNKSWEGSRSFLWDFGDGSTSNEINPAHTYLAPGNYSVTLSVSGPGGSATERKFSLVRVRSVSSASPLEGLIPDRWALHQNYPNPFNPSTTIQFELPARSYVSLNVYDPLGRLVATLVSDQRAAGVHRVTWNAAGYASGVYVYRLQADGVVLSRKLLIVK